MDVIVGLCIAGLFGVIWWLFWNAEKSDRRNGLK